MFFAWLIFSKLLRNTDFHADTKWSHIKSQNDLNTACYFLTIQFSVLIDHILVQEKEIASSLRQPANHTRDNQLIRLSKIPQKFFILFIFLIDKVHFDKHLTTQDITVLFKQSAGYVLQNLITNFVSMYQSNARTLKMSSIEN